MKKLISLILVLALGMTVFPAFAEEAETEASAGEIKSISWPDLYATVEEMGLSGDYYTLDGVQAAFWIPSFLKAEESDADDAESSMIGSFVSDNGEWGFYISFMDMDVGNIEEYAAAAEQIRAQEVEVLEINGLGACSFVYEDILYVSFLAGEGYVLSFDFYPASDYVFSAVSKIIAASVQPCEPQP